MRPLLLAAAALALLLAPFALPPEARAGGDPPQVPCQVLDAVCPDLMVDPFKLRQNNIVTTTFSATSCSVIEGMVPSAGAHELLRFTFTTPNLGPGDLAIGAPSAHPEWFVFSPCHNHYHFREYADYRLWTLDGYAQWAALRAALPTMTAEEVFALFPELQAKMVAGHKQGFCVIDLVPATAGVTTTAGLGNGLSALPRNYLSCGSDQGISVGWSDEYFYTLSGQWVVIDTVPAGLYMLEAEVNAERLYHEHDYSNNAAATPVQIP
ncbi:MAG TPA: lysyl oxidase family protein [Candidatus Thermoplasmatota archaeon]|jgi:hypothetical protein|nr:lysyl oxidase family protein [Candidatus Thermoplasmatota archaeon]